jgi:hypothetical protein
MKLMFVVVYSRSWERSLILQVPYSSGVVAQEPSINPCLLAHLGLVLLRLPHCAAKVRYACSVGGVCVNCSPARPKGRPKPIAAAVSALCCDWDAGQLTHEAPVLEGKALLQRVEGQVAAGALGVVVGAGELGAGALEAATGDAGRGHGGAEGCTGEHLETSAGNAIGGVADVLCVW